MRKKPVKVEQKRGRMYVCVCVSINDLYFPNLLSAI